ncbi:hypothetical protein [Streptomyces justiciae]|uniref:MmpS family membrane protein n=1 Tax=Streptomyces justiciae TaxID=2780140 RepID=A0ABU3M7I4_9ACTN|nr:hypothetical protein [Streptomyces justiciae]MDT7847475.1 hypothetical protein [Streptomyces justiciae]
MGAETGKPVTSLPESEKAPQEGAADEAAESRSARPDRAGLLIAGAASAACAGLVLYGVLDSRQDDSTPERRVPTAAVTYEVTGTGTADITYQARSESGKAVTVKAAALPWRKTVPVPLGRDPIVNVVLGASGGQARCTLTIRGQYIQGATANGQFGRATCTGTLPRPGAAHSEG